MLSVRVFVTTFVKARKIHFSKIEATFLSVKPSGNKCKDSGTDLQLLMTQESLVFESQQISVGWHM